MSANGKGGGEVVPLENHGLSYRAKSIPIGLPLRDSSLGRSEKRNHFYLWICPSPTWAGRTRPTFSPLLLHFPCHFSGTFLAHAQPYKWVLSLSINTEIFSPGKKTMEGTNISYAGRASNTNVCGFFPPAGQFILRRSDLGRSHLHGDAIALANGAAYYCLFLLPSSHHATSSAVAPATCAVHRFVTLSWWKSFSHVSAQFFPRVAFFWQAPIFDSATTKEIRRRK